MSSAMNTARKALDKAGRGGKPLRYRPDESEGLFMDLKDHIFPMVGGVVTLASQGHLPFPRQGVGYEKVAVLASELPLMRRGNVWAPLTTRRASTRQMVWTAPPSRLRVRARSQVRTPRSLV